MGNNLLCGSVYGLRIGGGFEAQNVGSGVGSSKNGLYRIIMIIYSVEAEFIHLVGVDYSLCVSPLNEAVACPFLSRPQRPISV